MLGNNPDNIPLQKTTLITNHCLTFFLLSNLLLLTLLLFYAILPVRYQIIKAAVKLTSTSPHNQWQTNNRCTKL